MKIDALLQLLRREDAYVSFLQDAKEALDSDSAQSARPRRSLDLPTAARPYVVSALQLDWPAPLLVIAGRPQEARQLTEQIQSWSRRPEEVVYFHAPDSLFYDRPPWDRETISARIGVLSQLALSRTDNGTKTTHPQIIVSSMWALMTKTLPPLAVRRATQRIAVGDRKPMYELLEACTQAGYERIALVEQPGTLAQRGSIVDIYPPNLSHPVRIDFFGDQIDTIRAFDPGTQRSQGKLESVILGPASEALPEWGQSAAETLQRMDLSQCNAVTQQHLEEARKLASQGSYFRGFEYLLPYLYPRSVTLLDYLPSNALLLSNDVRGLESAISELEEQAQGLREAMIRDGDLPASFPVPYVSWKTLQDTLNRHGAIDLAFGTEDEPSDLGTAFAPAPSYAGDLERALQEMGQACDQEQRIVAITRQAERISDLLHDQQIYRTPVEELSDSPAQGDLQLVDGILAEGFVLRPAGLLVLTDAEIFGWVHKRRRRRITKQEAPPEAFFEALRKDDYVVHIEHGIGQYHGMVKKTINGLQREYVEIEYAAGDRLYVPVHQTNRITRYSSGDARTPRIHRLGGTEWERVRERAEKQVRDLARELLELYALREISSGHAFAPDTDWQRELEASFEYEETEDQFQALHEIKRDMEKPKPMDRLLCGDVGYGKTEVALRAAFKAVMDGKQVAILVPTTILAQQHFRTFRQRLRPFPVMVEMLSRFRSRSEQSEIIERLGKGQIDIVVGTHRLLSKDVGFKNLGLLIIDEEQRFGVVHKERIKQLRHRIDVLTMTATPIPRTLYMSLSGIRDMSVIDTPPENRLAIRTMVTKYHEDVVRRAILRELDRGGQVYYVHNRVQDIEMVADEIHRIVPEASIAIGHGQMAEKELEQVMLGFAQGEDDILVCTTIIENGLDIPRVNTILIDRADTFGLAQLYQLRGRVGRGLERGYAYLFYKAPLSPVARARLETIQEASQLGAGFRVALRDLEIRGAGEILGPEQHGQIAAVGLDLYARLLRRAVEELSAQREAPQGAIARAQDRTLAEALARDMGPLVDLPLSAYIPEDYVSHEALRLLLYRRLARVSDADELAPVRNELRDRFGPLPESVANLLYTLQVRVFAGQAGAHMIKSSEGEITIILPLPLANAAADRLQRLYTTARARGTSITLPIQGEWKKDLIALLRTLQELEMVEVSL